MFIAALLIIAKTENNSNVQKQIVQTATYLYNEYHLSNKKRVDNRYIKKYRWILRALH